MQRDINNENRSSTQIVTTNQNYNYTIMMQNIVKLKEVYPFLEVGNIGYSVLGKEIPYIKLGIGKKEVLYHGSIHANEWITSVILIKFVEDFCKAYILNENIYNYPTKELFKRNSLYIIPMVNPDGVDLVTGNVDKNSNIYRDYQFIARRYQNISFPDGWKANFNGESLINFHL